MIATPTWASGQKYDLDIPASTADVSLKVLARQTGYSVIFQSEEARSAQTNAIAGQFSVNSALVALLEHTNLSYGLMEGDMITIIRSVSEKADVGVSTVANQSTRSSSLIAVVAASMTALFAVPGVAQDTSDAILEEVIVTAQRKEQDILKAAVAVSAFTEKMLNRSQVENLEDLVAYEPSLSVNQVSDGGANVFIRGVGNEIIGVGTDSSIAMYIDGVYLPRPNTAFQNFVDVERVEVVKGPQGTLYGRNATGGAINIITKQPTAESSFDASVGFGNYDFRQVKLAGGGTLVDDKLLGRVSFLYSERDNYAYNPFLDQRLVGEDVVSGRVSLKWLINDDIDVLFRYDKTRDSAFGSSNVKWIGFEPPVPIPDDPLIINSEFADTEREFRGQGGSMVVTWANDDYQFTSQTAWRDFDTDTAFDTSGVEIDDGTFESDLSSESISQEFRLRYLGNDRLDWHAGLFYFEDESAQVITVKRPPGGFLTLDLIADLDVEAWAAFAELSYNFTDRLTGTVGARYSWEEKDHISQLNIIVDGELVSSATLPLATGKADWNALTPRFVLEYDVTEDVFMYASASNGFKSGGFNSVARNELPVDQEDIWSYEFGIKGRYLDNRLQATATVFYYDYTDLQLRTFQTSDGLVDIRNTNAGKAKVTGLEFASQWIPIDSLNIEFSFALIDSEYTDYVTNNPRTDLPEDVSGNRLNQSPEFKSNLGATYRWDLGGGRLSLRGEFQYSSKYYFDQFNFEDLAEDGFQLWNAFLTYNLPNQKWTVSAWGRNLSDEVHYAQIFGAGFDNKAWLATPRTYGLRVDYRF